MSKANTRFVVRAETRETTPNQEANQVDVEKVVKDLQEKVGRTCRQAAGTL